MRLQTLMIVVAVARAAGLPTSASAAEELTGDPRLACEAILCLSSPTRPQECNASLQRHFSISYRHWSDTVNARRDFLKLCPASSGTDQNMPVLVNDIANGAGRCDASYFNASLAHAIQVRVCPAGASWDQRGGDDCTYKTIRVIDSRLPADCSTYTTNAYTYKLGVRYVGEPMDGGHWVDDAVAGQQ
jgi:TrbM